MFRAWICIFIFLVLLVVFAHATWLKERWFQPMLVTSPVFAAGLVGNRLRPGRLMTLLALGLAVMATVAVVLPGRLLMAERLGREEPLTRPYAEIAAQIGLQIPAGSLLICDSKLLAGNSRLGLKDVRVARPELTRLLGGEQPHWFLAWDARRDERLPEALSQSASTNGVQDLASRKRQYFTAVYHFHKTKEFKVGLVEAR